MRSWTAAALTVAAVVGLGYVHPFGDPRAEPAKGLSKANVQALSMLGQSASGSEAALAGEGDAVQGKAVFEKRCTGCHAMDVDREGPRLAGVYGRKAGSVPGFTYSTGLKNSSVTWNDATLEKWLSDPDLMVPDNNMSFSVPKAEERRNLIAYFKQR
jgi:cytochrome c